MRVSDAVSMLLAAALAFVVTVAAPAQEPDHLERLAGLCRTDRDVTLGRYSGRVLWLADGQLSGMLTQNDEAAADDDDSAPRSLTIAKQTPEATEDGLLLRTRVVQLAPGGDNRFFDTEVVCTLKTAPQERPDPGATTRG
jgi:hypothetical protein